MARGLVSQAVKKFRGLNVWTAFPNTSPEQATDILNVVPSGDGTVGKLRIPVTLSATVNQPTGPDSFAQFSNAITGIRQVLAQFNNLLGYFNSNWVFTLLDANAFNALGPFSYVQANNLFFGANGFRNFKFDGTNITKWGIDPPSAAPTFTTIPAPPAVAVNIAAVATTFSLATLGSILTRASNVTSVTGVGPVGINPGDIFEIDSVTDPTFDVTAAIALSVGPLTYANVGGNGFSTNGNITDFNQSGVYRYNNEVTVTTATPHGLVAGVPITIAGVTDTTFNGNFAVDTVIDATHFTYQQVGPSAFSGGGTVTPRNTAPAYANGGRRYRISFANSKTGHVSNASDASAATGNLDGTIQASVTGPASADPQVDTAWLWSTVDGGGDYYFNQTIPIVVNEPPVFDDTTLDANLNTALLAPFVNNPPPIATGAINWNGRIILFNLQGNPQGLAYSGYEQILVGRPEESFPPNNRLQMQIGADDIRGVGGLPHGLVIWDRSSHMFIVRGTLQDITVNAPVSFSAQLTPLPYAMGCMSQFSVVETPQGLVWLAADKTIQIFDGVDPPQCLSISYNPILRRITPGTEANCRATFFKYLERQWYCLSVAIDGSPTNNLIIVMDLDPNPDTNAGAFLCGQDNSLIANSIGVVELTDGKRLLAIGNQGFIKQFISASDTVNGISNPITSTDGTLGGYWLSGMFGNEDPGAMKIFRWLRCVADQGEFTVTPYLDDEQDNLRVPFIGKPLPVPNDGRVSINMKGRRMRYLVKFPVEDVSANMLELGNNYIKLADR